jgi:hypothetical protein
MTSVQAPPDSPSQQSEVFSIAQDPPTIFPSPNDTRSIEQAPHHQQEPALVPAAQPPSISISQSTPPPQQSPGSEQPASKTLFQKLTIMRWVVILLILLVMALVAMLAWSLFAGEEPANNSSSTSTQDEAATNPGIVVPLISTVDIIQQRGTLRCGVVLEQDGFSMIDSSTSIREGFEVDLVSLLQFVCCYSRV